MKDMSHETIEAANAYLAERARLNKAAADLRKCLADESKRKSQRRLARDLGECPVLLNNILSGTRNITQRFAEKIAGWDACTS